MAKSKENKKLTELGQKQRAGKLISEYIRAVGDEKTEVATVFTDPDTGEKKIISKAEAMVRDMWDKALNEEDKKLKLEYQKTLIERCEGKVGTGLTGADIEHPGRNVPDRVSDINKDRLNKLAKKSEKKSKKT